MHSRQSQVSLPVLLNDSARTLYINLSDGGKAYTIEDGCRAVFVAKKSDDKVLANDCIIENNATVRYDFTNQTASAEGIVSCEVRLYGADGRLITSPRFVMVVDARVVYDGDIPVSDSEKNTFDAIVLELNTLIQTIDGKLKNGDFKGEDGADGDGIVSIEQTGSSGLVDTYTVTLDSGAKMTFKVTNGADGHVPVKGVDYFTEADKAEMIREVIEGAADGDEVSY